LNQLADIEAHREMMKQKAFVAYMLLTDRGIELADKAQKPAEAFIPAGIMKDSWLQMAGVPSAVVRVDHHFDFTAKFEELRKEAEETLKAVKKAQVIEPPALTEGEAA
jgi:hypothetical protein